MHGGSGAESDVFICSVAHHLCSYSVITSVYLCESWFELRSLDHRSYRTWTTKLGLVHVAAMYSKANVVHGDRDFWNAIARCAELKEVEAPKSKRNTILLVEVPTASTQHVSYLPLVKSNANRDAYLVHQVP
jgi:UDP-galactopyranose mutase